MRSIPQFNFPSFLDAARRLREAGYEVVSPAEHDLEQGFFPFDLTGDEDLSDLGFDLREALRWDLEQVTKADAICVLPGWEKSSGARAEVAVAAALGLLGGTLNDFLRDNPELGMADRLLKECYSVQPWDDTDDIPDVEPPAGEDRDEGLSLVPQWALDPLLDGLKIGPVERALYNEFVGDNADYETRVTSSTGGQKGQKLARFDLIPKSPLWQVAELYGVGARKYADRNWERGYNWSLSFAALNRHLWQFWAGEDNDAETGLPHLASVVFHAFALMEYATTHPEFDDRPVSSGVLT
jgi:hypothetical protein